MSNALPPGKFWRDKAGLHVDTRGLAPPEPAVAIIWHMEQANEQGPIHAYLERRPVYLFPELSERGWIWEIVKDQGNDVQLILRADK